jgi:hypothetical protein
MKDLSCDWEERKKKAYALDREDEMKAIEIATCHFYRAIRNHPKGITLDLYIPHWVSSQWHRTDLYFRDNLEKLKQTYGKPIPIKGKKLKIGYSYVWIDWN